MTSIISKRQEHETHPVVIDHTQQRVLGAEWEVRSGVLGCDWLEVKMMVGGVCVSGKFGFVMK
jgi:hypothetical protein